MSGALNYPRTGHMSELFPAALTACVLLAGCGTMKTEQVAAPEPEQVPEPPSVAQPSEPAEPAEPVVQARAPVQIIAPVRQISSAENLLSYFAQLRKLSAPELVREHDVARQAFSSARSEFNRVRLAMVVTLPNTPFYDESRALDLLEPLARNSESQLAGLAGLLVSQIQERKRLDANTQALQQKLNALKSLERSLIERKR